VLPKEIYQKEKKLNNNFEWGEVIISKVLIFCPRCIVHEEPTLTPRTVMRVKSQVGKRVEEE
jgi:hypothetical protein